MKTLYENRHQNKTPCMETQHVDTAYRHCTETPHRDTGGAECCSSRWKTPLWLAGSMDAQGPLSGFNLQGSLEES